MSYRGKMSIFAREVSKSSAWIQFVWGTMSNWPRIAIQRSSAHYALCTMNLLITIVSSCVHKHYLSNIYCIMSRCKPVLFCSRNGVGMLKELDTLMYLDTLKRQNQPSNWKIASNIKLAVQRNMLSCTVSDHNKILTEAVQPPSTVTCGCTAIALTI